MKACSKGTAAAACLGYALITAALFWASPYIRPEPSTGVFLAAFSAASLWACKRLSVRGWLRGRALAGLLAAALYASFASFGYRLFLSGERMQFSAGRVGMLLLGVVWFVPVLLALLGLVERACVCMAARAEPSGRVLRRAFAWPVRRSRWPASGRAAFRWTPFFSSIRRWGCGLSTTGIP